MEGTSCIDNNTLGDGFYFVPFLGTLLMNKLAASITIALAALSAEDGHRLLPAQLTQISFFAFSHEGSSSVVNVMITITIINIVVITYVIVLFCFVLFYSSSLKR